MAWEFATEPEFQAKLDWARRLVDEEVIPLEALRLEAEQLDAVTAPLKNRVKEQGLWAAFLPPALGGSGLDLVKVGLLNEIIGRSLPACNVFGHYPPDSGNSEILALHGTETQKRRWLDPLLDGCIRSATAMTEPGAGADPTLITTRFEDDGDHYMVNGDKWFCTNANVADVFFIFGVTDPDSPPHRRASILMVDAGTPGLEVTRHLGSMMEPHPLPRELNTHCEVRFRDLRIPKENLLGEEGGGFAIMQERLAGGRIHNCMRWVGQAQRAFEMLCERSTYRYAHGSVLAEKQTVRNWIADSAAEIQALRLMTLHAAWTIDRHGSKAARKEIALVKFWGAQALHNVIDRAVQIHGSLGFSSDMPLEFMYRMARAARIYDGPDEVHRETVARLILRDYAAPPDGRPSEHVPTQRARAIERAGTLLDLDAVLT